MNGEVPTHLNNLVDLRHLNIGKTMWRIAYRDRLQNFIKNLITFILAWFLLWQDENNLHGFIPGTFGSQLFNLQHLNLGTIISVLKIKLYQPSTQLLNPVCFSHHICVQQVKMILAELPQQTLVKILFI